MNDNANRPPQPAPDHGPEALVEESRGLPLVWIIPIVALLIGAWLAYKTLSEQGPLITLTFKEAFGLEAGKTKIKYKDIEVGLVETVKLSDDLSQVIVTARMENNVAGHLGKDTRFWVVKPQFGLSGVSGLDTLMAGNYIAVEFGTGKPTRNFIGLEHAPKITADTPGRSFVLIAENAGSLQEGTPIYFRNIQAGRVVSVQLAEDKQSVLTEVFIDAPFDPLVRDSSRFWYNSAIDVSMSATGFDLKIGSFLNLLSGGIAFDTPRLNDARTQPSEPGTHFTLHKDFADINQRSHAHQQTFRLYFDDSVRGLAAGAPVEFRGINVGSVTDVRLDLDFMTKKVRIPVTIELDPEEFAGPEAVRKYLAANQNKIAAGRRPVLEKLVENGLRARLKTGSFVTGQLYVDLDLYPDAKPKALVYGGDYPEIPTLPSLTDELQKDAQEIITKLKKLPLDKIGEELLGAVKGANRLTNKPELQNAVASLDGALKDVRKLVQTADSQIVVIATGVEKSLASVRQVVQQMEPGSPMAVNLNKALEELSTASKSIRALTDYLDRHPDALIKGKSGYGGKP